MIPGLETILDAYYFVARRNGELARYVRRHVVAALGEAAALSGGREADEPAALFYAFARREEAFLCLDVAEGKVAYEDVRAWFEAHLVPVPPRSWPPR